MKLIELPKSPYWGANIHVGYYPSGKKKYSCRSSRVKRDPMRVNERGQREDKIEALQVLNALQVVANQAMAAESDVIVRNEFESMVRGVLQACGKRVAEAAPSWEQFATVVLDRHCQDLAESTARSYWSKKSAFDEWLKEHPVLSGGSSIADFKLADIQAFYDWYVESGGKTTTANGHLQGVSMIFQEAVISDFIAKNPCKGVRKRDNLMIAKQPFTLDDLSAIFGALAEHREAIEFCDEWALAIRFATFTGARSSDCVALRWEDFSEDFQRVRFVPKKKERIHKLGKIDASVSLLLPPFVAAEFKAACAVSSSEWVTPSLVAIRAGKRGLGPRFREILDLAGVEYQLIEGRGRKGIAQCSHSFHSFRHTLKSALREGGVSNETNNYVTGHEDSKVAARYIHEKAETIFRECSPVFEEFRAALEG